MRNKRDAIAKPLCWCLEQFGCTVQLLDSVGGGCPDAIVGFQGKNYLLEFKSKGGAVSPGQREWHIAWKGQVKVVWNLRDALSAINYDPPDITVDSMWQASLLKFKLEERNGVIWTK